MPAGACVSHPLCVAATRLEAASTSSGSMLLSWPDNPICCPADFEVMVRQADANGLFSPWRPASAPLIARRIPLEVMIRCEYGCAFKLRSLSAHDFDPSSFRGQLKKLKGDELILLPIEIQSAESAVAYTPAAIRATPHPPAARVGFFVHPPLCLLQSKNSDKC